MGSNCQSVLGVVIMVLSILALGCTVTALVFAILNLKELPEEEDPVEIKANAKKARERWRDATRKIIRMLREGNTIDSNFFHNLVGGLGYLV